MSWHSRLRKGLLKRRLAQRLLLRFGSELTPQRWIFLVGCYNSGTTLLRELLGQHPDIAALPSEGVRLTDALPRPEDCGWQRMWCRCVDAMRLAPGTPERAARIRRQWSLALPGDARNVLEKSIANTARMPFLQAHFQPAYIVHLVRNGYAVAEGLRRKSEPRRYGHDEFGEHYPISMCAEQWRVSLEVVDGDRATLQRFLEVRYEDLTADPGTTLRGVTDFLGLPPLPAATAEGDFHVHGVRSTIRDMNADSIGRLSTADLDAIDTEAGDALRNRGYDHA